MTEMEIMAIGGTVFWLVMAAWIAILWFLVEWEHGFLGFLSTVGYLCILQFGFRLDVASTVLHHPIMIGVLGIVYFIAGTGWSFFRWYILVKEKLEPYINMRTEWLFSKGQTSFKEVPDSLKEEWKKHATDWNNKGKLAVPLVKNHKSDIMRWIGWWPISGATWVFKDMFQKIVKMIYNYIHNHLQSIANSVFAVIKRDIPDEGVVQS